MQRRDQVLFALERRYYTIGSYRICSKDALAYVNAHTLWVEGIMVAACVDL